MKKLILAAALIFGLCFTAQASETGEWFFKNNISDDTRLVDIHMLGAHDAFTAGLNENSDPDEAGIKLGDDGGVLVEDDGLWKGIGLTQSRAQDADVETLLNSGVRYFDVRLSRYKNGGEFFTTHGRISDQFTGEGGIARKIADWAGKHPGEVIILDFQSLYDIETSNGGATQDSWKALMKKLESDGVAAYVHTSDNASQTWSGAANKTVNVINKRTLDTLTYGSLTEGGSRAAIVLFGQVTGQWADHRFINRRDKSEIEPDEAADGYVRSNWAEQSSFKYLREKLAEEINELKANSEKYYYKLRVMQAQTTGNFMSTLLADGDNNNIKILTDPDYDEWSELLPVLMVDNATTDADDFNAKAVELLAKKNREFTHGIYSATDGAVTLTGGNDLVPLGAAFSASLDGESLTLALSDGDITGEMELIIRSAGKKQRLYRGEDLLGETGADGLLRAKVESLGEFKLTDTDEAVDFAVALPLLRYSFTADTAEDIGGNGLNAEPVGAPQIGGGKATLTPGNVLKLPAGLTKHMKAYTVSAWVKMNADVSGSRLFDIGRNQRASVFANAGTNKDGSSSSIKNNSDTSVNTVNATGRALAKGEWTHVAALYDNGKLKLYLNGVLEASAEADLSVHPSPETINDYFNPNGSYIGRTMWRAFDANDTANPDINADVADFRIYSEALSEKEISNLARKPFARFVDIDTGEDIQAPAAIDVTDFYAGYAFPAAIGEYALVKAENVTDLAAGADAVGYYKGPEKPPADGLTLTRDGASALAEARVNEPTAGMRLYIAAYKDGTLLKAVSAPVAEGLTSLSLTDVPESADVRAFLWDMTSGQMKPVFKAEAPSTEGP